MGQKGACLTQILWLLDDLEYICCNILAGPKQQQLKEQKDLL